MHPARRLIPLLLLSWALWPASAFAQVDPELAGGTASAEEAPSGPSAPPRVFVTLGAGSSVRLVANLDFQQTRFAPSFIDAFGAWVFGGRGRLRQGVGLGLSTNLSGDGSVYLGLDPLNQLVLMPSYLLYVPLGSGPVPPFVAFFKAGVPMAVTPDFSPGLLVSAGATFMFLSGLGVYVEASGSGWIGSTNPQGKTTIHPMASIAAGLTIDYEVLP